MTLFALGALLALMRIVILVTGVAVHRSILIVIFSVAILAGDIHMFSSKRITSLAVVESNAFPVLFSVTARAGLPDSAFVFVVFLMTGVARGGSIPKLLLWLVTSFAVRFLRVRMSTTE